MHRRWSTVSRRRGRPGGGRRGLQQCSRAVRRRERVAVAVGELPGLSGHGHGRHRRPVVQRDGLEGRHRRREEPGRPGQVPRVADAERLRAEHQRVPPAELQHHHHGRLPAGRRHGGRGQGQPRPAVRDRRLRVRPDDPERARPDVRDGPVVVPGRSPRGRHDQDREGRYVRRPEDPDGDDLHAGLRGRNRLLQPEERDERPAARVEPGQAERACSPATSRTRTTAGA